MKVGADGSLSPLLLSGTSGLHVVDGGTKLWTRVKLL